MNARPNAVLSWFMAVVLGLGLITSCASSTMPSHDAAFARDMIAHHEQAVQMALSARDRSENGRFRLLSLDMALTQQAQVGMMMAWLDGAGESLAGDSPPMMGMGLSMGMASGEQLRQLEASKTTAAEVLFLQLMIRHHQGGVYMAEDILTTSNNPQVRRLAQTIIAGQRSEIDVMTELLTERQAKPLPVLERMDMGTTHSHR
jgi:uncharacterized protein (DUF305 family)